MGVYLPLPSEYQEVEYIQSSGTQWINTGLFASNNIQVETKVEVTQTAQDKPVFGCVSSGSGSNSIGAYYHLTCYNSKWYYGLNNQEGNAGTYSPTVGTQYTIIYNGTGNGLYINGSNIATLTGTVGISGSTLGISYRGYTSGTNNRKGQYKYFYFKMYDKSTSQYVRDFVPCYRKSDNVIGLYDLVNSQFYTNSGTGTFSKGADVTAVPLKNAYIGEVWTPGANTLAYFPFNDDLLDHSGNGVTLSNTSYFSKQALGYKWQFSQGNTGNNIYAKFTGGNAKFISIWYNVISSSGNSGVLGLEKYGYVAYNPSHGSSSISGKIVVFTNSSRTIGASAGGMSFNAWHHLTIGFDGSKILISKDGEQVTLYNGSGYNFGNGVNIVGGGNNTNLQCLVSEFICESECWSAAEISNYYNQTKSNYGL